MICLLPYIVYSFGGGGYFLLGNFESRVIVYICILFFSFDVLRGLKATDLIGVRVKKKEEKKEGYKASLGNF